MSTQGMAPGFNFIGLGCILEWSMGGVSVATDSARTPPVTL